MPTPTFGARLLRLGSESLVYGLGSIVGRLLSFLLQPYYAHRFDPAQNGVQSVVYSYVPIISIGLYLGMDVAYMRLAAFAGASPAGDHDAAAVDQGAERRRAPIATLDVTSFRYMKAIVFTDALLAVPYAHLRNHVKPAYWSGLAIVPVILLGYAFSGMYAVVAAGLYIEKHTRALPWISAAGLAIKCALILA